jgi:phosphatidate cytidylyltransferase
MTSTRLLAAAVGLLVVLPLVFWGGMPGTLVVLVFALTVCLDEYARMAFPGAHLTALAWLWPASAAVGASALWAPPRVTAAVLALVVMGTMVRVTVDAPEPISLAADRVGRYLVGIAWIGGLLPFLAVLRGWDHGIAWVLLVMVIAWAGDTGAYFAGRALGGRLFGDRKLAPRVSPKKSWEGFVGGIVGSAVGAVIVVHLGLPNVGLAVAAVIGATGSAISVLGDLSESLLKRAFDVKDSGWIMPGHGGLLDRIDSLLFVAPVVYTLALVGGAG